MIFLRWVTLTLLWVLVNFSQGSITKWMLCLTTEQLEAISYRKRKHAKMFFLNSILEAWLGKKLLIVNFSLSEKLVKRVIWHIAKQAITCLHFKMTTVVAPEQYLICSSQATILGYVEYVCVAMTRRAKSAALFWNFEFLSELRLTWLCQKTQFSYCKVCKSYAYS